MREGSRKTGVFLKEIINLEYIFCIKYTTLKIAGILQKREIATGERNTLISWIRKQSLISVPS